MAILEAVFADKAGQTPQEVERRRRMAQALLEAGSGGPAPSSGLELAGRLAMNLMGQYQAGQAEKQDASNRTSANKALIDAVYGGSPSASAPSFASQAAATSPSASSGGNPSYRDAIASIESKGSGDYNAVGPTNAKMGRALGRYQIMEANIGPWSKEALGREVSADEFMSNPQIQDAIFDHKFGSYVNKFGPEGAAQAWFAGPGGVGKTDRKDVLGTDVGTYGQKFLTALGPQSKPVEVASLGGASIDAPMAYYDDKGFRVENRPPVIQPDPNARPAGASAATVEANAPQNAAQAVNAMAAPRNVGALPVPPNSQPMPQGITAEFAGSQQLANAQGGIIPALMGGTAASPEQVAQARALGAAQPQPQPQGQDNRALIATLLGNPYTAEAGQQLLMQEMQRRQEANDPVRQMQMEEQRLKLDALRNPGPEYDMITGKDGSIFRADKRTGNIEQVYGGKPDKFRTLTDAEEQQLGLDTSKAYQVGADNKVAQIGGGGTTVNIDQKAEGAFDKKLAEKQAETFDTMATEGLNARADIGIIQELDTLLQGQGGTLSGIAGIAAKYGIGGEGMGDLQAVQALINKLVPTQRAPGSGSMSDRDVELFTRSLPSLWNEPGGNAKILRVMRGLAEYKQAQGEIADQVLTGDMSRQEARRALRALPNPLAQSDPSQDVGKVPEGIDPEDWKALTPEERKLWQ